MYADPSQAQSNAELRLIMNKWHERLSSLSLLSQSVEHIRTIYDELGTDMHADLASLLERVEALKLEFIERFKHM